MAVLHLFIKTEEFLLIRKKNWKQTTFCLAVVFSISLIKEKIQLTNNLRSETEKQDVQKVSRHLHKETETALAAFFQATTWPQCFLGQILQSSSLEDLEHSQKGKN